MFAKLFLLFAILPIVEIALLINVGEVVGGWNTVAIVIITAFIGAHLVKQEGIQTLTNAQNKMRAGEMPGHEMAEGVLLLVAGVLLVTPGFITDGIGFLFSMPLTRPLLAKVLVKQFGHKIVMHHSGEASFHHGGFQHESHQQSKFQQQSGSFHYQSDQQPTSQSAPKKDQHAVIEGEYQRKDD